MLCCSQNKGFQHGHVSELSMLTPGHGNRPDGSIVNADWTMVQLAQISFSQYPSVTRRWGASHQSTE